MLLFSCLIAAVDPVAVSQINALFPQAYERWGVCVAAPSFGRNNSFQAILTEAVEPGSFVWLECLAQTWWSSVGSILQ